MHLKHHETFSPTQFVAKLLFTKLVSGAKEGFEMCHSWDYWKKSFFAIVDVSIAFCWFFVKVLDTFQSLQSFRDTQTFLQILLKRTQKVSCRVSKISQKQHVFSLPEVKLSSLQTEIRAIPLWALRMSLSQMPKDGNILIFLRSKEAPDILYILLLSFAYMLQIDLWFSSSPWL